MEERTLCKSVATPTFPACYWAITLVNNTHFTKSLEAELPVMSCHNLKCSPGGGGCHDGVNSYICSSGYAYNNDEFNRQIPILILKSLILQKKNNPRFLLVIYKNSIFQTFQSVFRYCPIFQCIFNLCIFIHRFLPLNSIYTGDVRALIY